MLKFFLFLAAFGLVGCVTSEDGAALSSSLSEEDVEPLLEVPRAQWQSADAGCEGVLSQVAVYGIAERHPELVVGLRADLSLICVDTYHAVHGDLVELSHSEEEALRLRYHATLWGPERHRSSEGAERAPDEMHELHPIDLREVQGDPMPQPNIVGDLLDERYREFLDDED